MQAVDGNASQICKVSHSLYVRSAAQRSCEAAAGSAWSGRETLRLLAWPTLAFTRRAPNSPWSSNVYAWDAPNMRHARELACLASTEARHDAGRSWALCLESSGQCSAVTMCDESAVGAVVEHLKAELGWSLQLTHGTSCHLEIAACQSYPVSAVQLLCALVNTSQAACLQMWCSPVYQTVV